MWTTYKATIRMLLLTPSAVVWALIFPIVLTTVFNFMFEPLRAQTSIEAVEVAVVDDEAWRDAPFAQVVDALTEGDEPLLKIHAVESEHEAREVLEQGVICGAYAVDAATGEPHVILAPLSASSDSDASYEINRSIIEAVATSYLQNQELVTHIAASNPMALANTGAVQSAFAQTASVQEISLTHSQPDTVVRFYYALLGMASLFAAQLAEDVVWKLQPRASQVGARRAVSGTSSMRLLAQAIAACWTVSTGFLAIAFGYICVTAHIDFAGRELLCLTGIAAASALSCGIGAAIGALPGKLTADSRSGILTAATCLLSIFAGLYGEPTMALADRIAQAFPAAMWINPVSLIRDLFYSLYYYDALAPFLLRAGACVGMAALFCCVAVAFMRRQNREHL